MTGSTPILGDLHMNTMKSCKRKGSNMDIFTFVTEYIHLCIMESQESYDMMGASVNRLLPKMPTSLTECLTLENDDQPVDVTDSRHIRVSKESADSKFDVQNLYGCDLLIYLVIYSDISQSSLGYCCPFYVGSKAAWPMSRCKNHVLGLKLK